MGIIRSTVWFLSTPIQIYSTSVLPLVECAFIRSTAFFVFETNCLKPRILGIIKKIAHMLVVKIFLMTKRLRGGRAWMKFSR